MTKEQAIEQLAMNIQANNYPSLSSSELNTLIDKFKRWNVWTANTAYSVGAIVVSPTYNGRRYECVKPGTSGTQTTIFPESSYGVYNGVYGDGPDIFWRDIGPATVEQYDVMSASRAGWLLKASKVSHLIGTKDGQQDIQSQELQKHFLEMANKYRPMEII